MSLKGELLQQGIQALENGNPAAAAAAFTRLVKQLPEDDEGWLWLGKAVTQPERKEFCFKRAIQLNPANAEAGHLLAELGHSATPAPKPAAPAIAESQPARPGQIPFNALFTNPSPAASVSPFVKDEMPAEQTPTAETVHASGPVDTTAPEPAGNLHPEPQKSEGPGRKKSRRVWIALGILAALIVCGVAAFFLLSSGLLDDLTALLPVQPLPTQALFPTATPPQGPAPTGSPTPTAETPTPALDDDAPVLATMLPTVAYTASFRDTPCEFDKPAGIAVNCGVLTVPENRTDPSSGNIELAVAIFRSTAASPAPDPVVFLQGGPGGEAVLLSAAAFPILVEPFLAERDFIAIDQRGTGLSEPALGCDELVSVYKQDIEGQIPESSRGFIYDNAFRSCHGMMAISGIDLNAYTTLESAADIRDLAASLGLAQINLYGASYGTRLAQVIMRSDPALVRSAVLDSVVPVDVALYNTDQIRFGYALEHLFSSCSSDRACNRAYSDLETVFWDTVARLNEAPVSVTAPLLTGGEITEEVSGSDLIGIVLGMLKQSDLIASVPQAIYRIRGGDYSTFVAAQSSLPFAFEGIDIGLYISMMCHEHIMATSESELEAALETQMDLGLYSRLPFLGDAGDIIEICHVWGAEAPRLGENNPLVSDISTLVIEGAFDPTTPPIFGQRILSGLGRATYVEFPNQGHVPTAADISGCAMQIVQDFISAPQQTPDISCAAELEQIGYILPYTGTPPEALAEYAGEGFSARVPASWDDQGGGQFLRSNSPMDITQVLITRTFLSSSELLDSLSSTLYGYQGFDSAPVQNGIRQQNGLSWSLYQTASYGRPVELAMADDNGTAIVVLLFCHEDERAALIETVFLPMIDSVQPAP